MGIKRITAMLLLSTILVMAVFVAFSTIRGKFFEAPTEGGPAVMRLISSEQYVNAVHYLFGEDIDLSGAHFPLVPRRSGLVALGSTEAAMTPGALEMFNQIASAIAAQTIDPSHRSMLVPCAPVALDRPDAACASKFLSHAGRFLFRRPLSDDERKTYVTIAGMAAESRGNFYDGIAYSLAGMMTSPKFLYVTETSEPDPENPGQFRLDAYSKASRLSLFLWNALPDETLLTAAETGALHDKSGIEEQVTRMLSSPRAQKGVRAFFSDLLQFQEFSSVTKDSEIYPAFTFEASKVINEQALRMIIDHLMVRQGDYRELFTTDRTFINRALGLIYKAAVPIEAASDEWLPYRADGANNAGLLTSLSFLAAHSHPGRSSPTLRGKALREIFLCQRVPDPPPTVDFAAFEDLSGKLTARARLEAHAKDPACAGCHKLTDPVGLALEYFDGAGQFRTKENGAAIDIRGEFDGRPFSSISEIGKSVGGHPALTPCLVRRLFAYGVGRDPGISDRAWLGWMDDRFRAHNYRFPDLMREVAESDAFYAVAPPEKQRIALSDLLQMAETRR